MKNYTAAILTIGTELTTGQIVNQNASSISKSLKAASITTQLHLVVPDNHDLMLNAIEICSKYSDWIFITGGLGPTSDDFTRNVVAEWSDLKLEWDEDSWISLNERLSSRGYEVKNIQRQQCYFPAGARILRNKEGTANGFHISVKNKEIFVLPGPPREIEACWEAGITNWIFEKTKLQEKYITKIWDSIGLGESDLAMLVEPLLEKHKVEIGYRVHLPYVEFKISYYSSEQSHMNELIQKIDIALQLWIITKDGDDILQMLQDKLLKNKIPNFAVIDELSGSFLLNRMHPLIRKVSNSIGWTFSTQPNENLKSDLIFKLVSIDENTAEVSMYYQGQFQKEKIQSPYKTLNMAERRRQYFAEFALICWQRWI